MARSTAVYWASLGGFAVPLLLLSLLILDRGQHGLAMPVWFGLALGAWFALNTLALGPSGFALGLLVAGLLLAGARRARAAGGQVRAGVQP